MFENPETWVRIGLLAFAVLLIVMKVPQNLWKSLGATGDSVRAELDEAVRIRQEAQTLLNSIKAQRLEAEQKAKELVAFAEDEAKRLAEEARVNLAESIRRRQAQAEARIAQAEARAASDVKSAAADLASQIAEEVLIKRASGLKGDAQVDSAISQIGKRFS